MQKEHASEIHRLKTSAEQQLTTVQAGFEAELRAQEERLNKESKGISELQLKLQELQDSHDQLESLHASDAHAIEVSKQISHCSPPQRHPTHDCLVM